MAKKTISLSVDQKVYDTYNNFCKERGIIISKQVELFMKKELEKKEE